MQLIFTKIFIWIIFSAIILSFGKPVFATASSDSMAAYWKLDESSGNAADSSGDAHTGTVSGASSSTSVPSAVTFTDGRSLNFNGSSNYVNTGNASGFTNLPQNNFTYAFWMNKTAGRGLVAGNSYVTISGKCKDNSSFGWGIATDDTGNNLSYNIPFSTTTATGATANGIVSNGTWTHVALVWNGTTKTGQYYVNGNSVSTSTTAGVGTYAADNVSNGYTDLYRGSWL